MMIEFDRRISIILSSLQGGGAERAMVNIGEEFADRGCEVNIVALRAAPQEYEVSSKISIFDVRAPRIYAALPGLVMYLQRQKPGSVISATTPANIVTLLAAKVCRYPTKVVISAQNTLSSVSNETADWRKWLLPLLAKMTYDWADEIVATSRGVARDLGEVTNINTDRMHVVGNPVVTPLLFEKAKEKVDHQWFSDCSVPVILGAGRLVEQKSFSTLIRSFASLRARLPARLLILGDGPKRPELVALSKALEIDEDVHLLGFVENPYKYMKRADVFVLSSKFEGFGNVLVEAMACGCPVVSTDCPHGPSEILEDGKWGELVPVGDADALASALKRTLSRPRVNGIKERAMEFEREKVVDKYSKLL